MPARPGWQDVVFRPESVENSRKLETWIHQRPPSASSTHLLSPASQPIPQLAIKVRVSVHPWLQHQSPTRKQLHETEHSHHALTHHFTPPSDSLTSGLGETRIPNWRHVQPSSWGEGRGEGDTVSEPPGVRSPQPAPRGDTASRMVSTPSPQKKKPEIGMRERMGNSRRLWSLPQMPVPALQVNVSCPRVNRDVDPRHQTTWTCPRLDRHTSR